MKKTEYFTSSGKQSSIVVESVKTQRDAFLERNADNIARIDNEDIKIITYGQQNTQFFIIIQLTYYPKV